MIRKLTVALAAIAVVGTAALAPSAAKRYLARLWLVWPSLLRQLSGLHLSAGLLRLQAALRLPALLPSLEARGLVEQPLPLLIARLTATPRLEHRGPDDNPGVSRARGWSPAMFIASC